MSRVFLSHFNLFIREANDSRSLTEPVVEEEGCSDQPTSTSRLGSLCSDSSDTQVVSFSLSLLRPSLQPSLTLSSLSTDVVDLAWSRDDTMIATVGLDSMVFVWDASTFSEHVFVLEFLYGSKLTLDSAFFFSGMITKIGLHEGFVKGVCWDPVGEYLATQVRLVFLRSTTTFNADSSPCPLSPTTSLSRSGEPPTGVSPRPSLNPSTTLLGQPSSDD